MTDEVHVVVSESGSPVCVTPDHETAVDALIAVGRGASLYEGVEVIGQNGGGDA